MGKAGELKFRLADHDDDSGIRAVFRRNVMPGSMSLAFTHEPNFFAAIEVEGYSQQVMVVENDGELAGSGVIARRRVYLNGQPAEVGYLSSLRVDSAFRNTTVMGRGYRYLRQLHESQPGIPFYLSTIMEENVAARELLTSGRAGLPNYREIGKYVTTIIPLIRRPNRDCPIAIINGTKVGSTAIADFLNKTGPSRQFFPVYTATDIDSPTGILRGLQPENFLAAISGDEIVGVMACWNQLPFRQHVVAEYHGMLKFSRPVINFVSSAFGCRMLPDPGEPVNSLLAAGIAIKNDDPAIFRALLRHALAIHSNNGSDLFFIGMAANDPLLPIVTEPWHITLHSRIYTVDWNADAANRFDAKVPYLELGGL